MTTSDSPSAVLLTWLQSRLVPPQWNWLHEAYAKSQSGDRMSLFIAFGQAGRKVPKSDLSLSTAELEVAGRVRSGWKPVKWTIDQAARVALVLGYQGANSQDFLQTLDKLFVAGEMGELVALYQALCLFPNPDQLVLRTAEGIRSNMKPVFKSVAHRNPYPSEFLPEARWNQMVLKCLFVDLLIDPIVGLDARRNANLSRMLLDFAAERKAAGRPVSPELWRCVGPFADEATCRQLAAVLSTGGPVDRPAAALALAESPGRFGKDLLQSFPHCAGGVAAGTLTWQTVATQLGEATTG